MKKRTLALTLLSFVAGLLPAQTTNFFQPLAEDLIEMRGATKRDFYPEKYQTYRLEYSAIKTALQAAPMEFTPAAREHKCLISIPLPGGKSEEFAVWQTAILEPALAAEYPEIRTFAGQSLRTAGRSVRIMYSPRGFEAMVLQPDLGVAYVGPYAWGQDEYYIAYDRADLPHDKSLRLGTGWLPDKNAPLIAVAGNEPYVPAAEYRGTLLEPVKLKVYRYIASTTGEFAQDHGGTKPLVLAAVTSYTMRLNAIYERDVNMRFQIVTANNSAIFLDPDTDPFTGTSAEDWLEQNPGVLNSCCNPASHDIGHVYARYLGNGPGGVGGLGVVCGAGKARGCTVGQGFMDYGDGFVSTLGQEVGHQLSGGHSWNRCLSNNQWFEASAFEPGSGSTIMSYAGSCGSDNVQGYSDLYFHSGSIEELKDYYTTGFGNTCGSMLTTNNNPPVVTLPYPDGLYIPIKTPFELDGSATDPDGDTLRYIWEGIDSGPQAPLGEQEANSAIFRTYPASLATNRYFPRLSTILTNSVYKPEILPEYTRDVTLRFTARDGRAGGGGTTWADLSLKSWGAAGPFLVTWPNAIADTWYAGEYVNVTWDVANTQLAPVNCHTVNIRLSTDGGLTYPITLASGVNNDGSQYVLVPDNLTSSARVRVDAAENVFFDISNANFNIQQPAQPTLTLGLSADAANICLPASFSTEVLTAGSLGFNNPVSLEITGDLPPGAVANFSATTLNPGETSTLHIDLSNVATGGTFTFNLEATAAGSPVLVRPITLSLVSNDFSDLALETPTDGGTNQALAQTLRWNPVPDADAYDVQFSNSPSFSTILASKTATPIDSFKVPFLLEKGKAYYWRVRPRNVCGVHEWSEPFFFSTYAQNCSVFSAIDLPKNISANSTPTVESKITINAGGAVSDVNVEQIKGYHAFFKDLEAQLISPQGVEVLLFKDKCGNSNGVFNFGLDDASPIALPCPPPNNSQFYRPDNLFSPFYGQDNTGTWTLRVKDNVISSGGTLDFFKLEFCVDATLSPPFLVNNNPLTIQTGQNQAILPDLLLAEDADNTHAELTFTLVTVPKHGELQKNWGAPMQPGDQFTQAELDAGALRFFDFGTNGGADGFRFVLSDGEGSFLGTPKFVIQPLGVGTDEPFDKSLQFSLFPNPATDAVWLALARPAESDMRVNLFNTAGQLVQTAVLPDGSERLEIRLAGLPKGIYVLRLEGEAGTGVRKLILD